MKRLPRTSSSRTVQRYERLAWQYDRRWSAYTSRTLERLLAVLTLSGTERVLDIGCGTGEFERLAFERFPNLTIVGLDATPAMAAVARQKLVGFPLAHIQLGRADALPFSHECFDVLVSASMLHHVGQVAHVVQESTRVLRPGGQFVVVDWCLDFWHGLLAHYWLRLVDPTYVRMYRLRELQQLFEASGMEVKETARFIAPPLYGMLCINAVKKVGGAPSSPREEVT